MKAKDLRVGDVVTWTPELETTVQKVEPVIQVVYESPEGGLEYVLSPPDTEADVEPLVITVEG